MQTTRLLLLLAVLAGALRAEVHQWRFLPEHATESGKIEPTRGAHVITVEGKRSGIECRGDLCALEIDGHTGRFHVVGVTGADLPSEKLSAEAWVRVDRAQEWGSFVGFVQDNGSYEKGWLLGFRKSSFTFAISSEGADDGNGVMTYLVADREFELGHWHHVAGTYDGKEMRIYVDGELAGTSDAQSGKIAYPPQSSYEIGAYKDDNEHYRLQGAIHEITVRSSVLGSSRIARRFELTKHRFPEPVEHRSRRLALGPYLEHVGRDAVRIRWQTEHPSPTVLHHGVGPLVLERKRTPDLVRYLSDSTTPDAPAGTEHEVVLRGLGQDTTYYYAIEESNGDGGSRQTEVYTFDTALNYSPQHHLGRERVGAPNDTAAQVITSTGVNRGYALVVGAADATLAAGLASASDLQVIQLEPDAERAQALRRWLDDRELHGQRVSVHTVAGPALPYTDYLANLIVVASAPSSSGPAAGDRSAWCQELYRVSRPAGGTIALLPPASSLAEDLGNLGLTATREAGLTILRRGKLAGAGEWTHQYGNSENSSCSDDEHVRGDMEVQWFGRPGPRPMPDRGPRNPAPVSAGGRLYIQGDRILFGLDAYNGTILWSLEIPVMRRANVVRDSSNMTADDEHVYVAIEDACWRIDGRTGRLEHVYRVPTPLALQGSENVPPLDWGLLLRVGDLLLGTAVREGATYEGDHGEWYEGGAQGEVARVTGASLFALDVESGALAWEHGIGAVLNPTVSVQGDRVYLIEARGEEAMRRRGERLYEPTLREQVLVALDRDSGERVWETPHDLSNCQFMIFLSAGKTEAGKRVLLASGSRIEDKTYFSYAFDAESGKPLWETEVRDQKGHHSGHLQHPVLLGGRVFHNRQIYDLATGETVGGGLLDRRGCGTMTASAGAIFYRHHFHGMWDLETDERRQWFGIRSGCWLSIIPSGGLLLAPESSAGCSCTHAIQTSVAFKPKSR